jgi:hypothetical protein
MHEIGRFIDDALGLSALSANDLTVPQAGLRAVVVYFALILFVRLGKKRFLGQATAFDAVLIILIGSVASRAVSGTAPFVASLAATLSFIVVHWIVPYVAQSSSALEFSGQGSRHGPYNERPRRPERAARRAHVVR